MLRALLIAISFLLLAGSARAAAPALQPSELFGLLAEANDIVVLEIRNAGHAHGRLDGFLVATDARGREFDVTPATTPILPGETRGVAMSLTAKGDPGTAGRPEFPLMIKGKLEWGRGRSTDVLLQFGQ